MAIHRWFVHWTMVILHSYLVGGLEHCFFFSIQLGMSSSQLTNSDLQRGRYTKTSCYLMIVLDRLCYIISIVYKSYCCIVLWHMTYSQWVCSWNKWWFSIVLLNYQRISGTISHISVAIYICIYIYTIT